MNVLADLFHNIHRHHENLFAYIIHFIPQLSSDTIFCLKIVNVKFIKQYKKHSQRQSPQGITNKSHFLYSQF